MSTQTHDAVIQPDAGNSSGTTDSRARRSPISLPRHQAGCTVCHHAQRATIEEKFCDWIPQTQIAREHRISRLALYRHVKACGELLAKRDANLRCALARFIERGFSLRPTGATFIAAVVAYSRLDALGRTVDRKENVTTAQSQFARMDRAELRAYAETGDLPAWGVSDTPRRTGSR